eukprot:jgi/Tetstr1/434108/TSEL_023252.t1
MSSGGANQGEGGAVANKSKGEALLDVSGKSLEWMGQDWPISTSLGKSPMGTSPYGKSVDMVDMCTALMEAGARAIGSHPAFRVARPISRVVCQESRFSLFAGA